MPQHVINQETPSAELKFFWEKTTLTDAMIKTLPTVGVEVAPAPGANKIIIPIAAFGMINYVGDAYINTDPSVMLLLGPSAMSGISPISAYAERVYFQVPIPWSVQPSSGAWSGKVISEAAQFDDSAINAPLILKDEFPGGSNYTGGNPGNTMEVTVFYSIVDL